MVEGIEVQNFKSNWSFKDSLISQNKEFKKEKYGLSDGEKISSNVNGFIINSHGNIVAKFNFFILNETEENLELEISTTGFLGSVYHKNVSLLIGYGHNLGFDCLVDCEKTQILNLKSEYADGEPFIINIFKDKLLVENGLICIIRDEDVMSDLLSDEVKDDYFESCEFAKIKEEQMSELEISFNEYLKKLYVVLGEQND